MTALEAAGDVPSGSAFAVRTEGLTKHYGDVVALDGLDLSIPTGSVFGLLGPNGAGKTTTLRLLTGLGRPTHGSATVAGIPVSGDRRHLTRGIGYLGQDPRFYAWMTGRELLELTGRAYGLTGAELGTRVAEVLETIGLTDSARRRIGGYSGGMRQRLGVGQAILPKPQVLFLDEPVSALDPAGRRDVLELIGSLSGSASILMSTHILNDVERVCDRIGILDRGRLVTEGPIDDLLVRHARPILELEPEPGQEASTERLISGLRAAAWCQDARFEHGLIRIIVTDAAQASAAALPMVVAGGVQLIRYERVRPTLEDVFLELVGEEAAGPRANASAEGAMDADTPPPEAPGPTGDRA